ARGHRRRCLRRRLRRLNPSTNSNGGLDDPGTHIGMLLSRLRAFVHVCVCRLSRAESIPWLSVRTCTSSVREFRGEIASSMCIESTLARRGHTPALILNQHATMPRRRDSARTSGGTETHANRIGISTRRDWHWHSWRDGVRSDLAHDTHASSRRLASGITAYAYVERTRTWRNRTRVHASWFGSTCGSRRSRGDAYSLRDITALKRSSPPMSEVKELIVFAIVIFVLALIIVPVPRSAMILRMRREG